MSFYDRAIAGLFPDYGVKRLQARQVVAAYEAAKTSRTHKPRREGRGPSVSSGESAVSLREQGRYLEENNDIAKGALDILVARTVGMGIIPEFMVEDADGNLLDEVNERLSELYEEWCRHPEVTRDYDETAAQRISARTFFRDGEILTQHLVGSVPNLDHGSLVPYSYEMIEADQLPMDYNNVTPRIVSGVELNGWGRATAYHMLKGDPNDVGRIARFMNDTRVISASRITHLKNTKRIRQVRGVSVFAVVLKRLQDINEIDETERVATRMAAAMAVYIKKGDPTLYSPSVNASGEPAEQREIGFEPGMVIDDLMPGEEIGSIDSNRPNNQLIPFKENQIRHLSGGIGVSNSSLSKNYNGSYSSQRQELVEQHDIYGVMWKYFVERGERPKIENFTRMAIAAGLVKIPPTAKQTTLLNVNFSRPAMPWIQPLQEANGWLKLKEGRIESTSEIIRSRGRSPRIVRKQLQREDKQDAIDNPQPTV